MAKERIYLTYIALHTRNHRPSLKFSKAERKDIIYEPLLTDNDKELGKIEMSIPLKEDLLEKIGNGEVEIMVPQNGLNIFAGNDIDEKLVKTEKKKWNELIHRNRKNVWRADKV